MKLSVDDCLGILYNQLETIFCQQSYMNFLRRHLLNLFTVSLIGFIGYLSYEKYLSVQSLPSYSLEEALSLNKNPKNKPLILELYRLNDQILETEEQSNEVPLLFISNDPTEKSISMNQVADAQVTDAKILLNRICKDSCRALRCRMDPGLGHACRVNCPQHKITHCRLAVKLVVPAESPSVEVDE